MAKTYSRDFHGPWPQAFARMQLYLLQMLAARPQPAAIELRLAKRLASPDDIRRDLPPLRDALEHRLGAACVQCVAEDDAGSHRIRLECAAHAAVQSN